MLNGDRGSLGSKPSVDGDVEACALSAGFRQKTWSLIRDRIAQDYPERATVLADYTFTVLMGMSAAAREGKSVEELQAIGQIAAAGIAASGSTEA